MIDLLMRLTGLSRGLTIAGLVSLAVLGLGVAKCRYDRGVIRENEAKIAVQVAATSSAAADAAATTTAATRADVQKGNDDARKAAAAGADPLGDGLRSLRAESGADRAAARRPDNVRR